MEISARQRWNGAGLLAQQEPRSSAQQLLLLQPKSGPPHAQPASGPSEGPPPPTGSPLPKPGGDPASPGLSGAHSREVRNHGFTVASAGGHRGHLGRPRAPGPGPPAAPPRPGHVHDARAASRNKGRRVARAQSRWAALPVAPGPGPATGVSVARPPSFPSSVARSNKGRARGTHRNMSTH